MKKRRDPQEEKRLKGLLGSLKEIKISKSGRDRFMSEIDRLPAHRKPGLDLSDFRRRIEIGAEELVGKVQEVFVRPVPAYARAAVLLLMTVSVYFYTLHPQTPAIQNVKGMVKVFNAGKGEWMIAKNNLRVKRNDIIKTFGDGRVDVELKDVYSMRLKSDSEITVGQLSPRIKPRNIKFYVEKGKVLAYYKKSKARRRAFELETKEVVASALGTDFMLEAMPKMEKTWVGVLDGIVKVTSIDVPEGIKPKDATVYVESRQKTEVLLGRIPKKPEMMIEEEWLQLEELYSIGKKPQVALLISTGPTRTRELLAIAPLYISDEEPSVLPKILRKLVEDFNVAIKEASREKHIENIRQFEDIIKKYPNPKYDVQFYLFIGAYYEFIEDHARAIATFRKAIENYPESPLASVAQCAIGIINEEKLKDKEKAKEAYQNVITKYPASPEAKEAISGLKRLSN